MEVSELQTKRKSAVVEYSLAAAGRQSLLITAAVFLLPTLFAPVAILSSNAGELVPPSIGTAVSLLLGAAAAAVVMFVVLVFLMRGRLLRPVAVLVALGLLLYLQFDFFAWQFGSFDGTAIDFGAYLPHASLEAVVIVGFLVAAVVMPDRVFRFGLRMLGVLLAIHLVGALYQLSTMAIGAKEEHVEPIEAFFKADPEQVALSPVLGQKNVIVFLIDTAQGDLVAQIFRDRPEVASHYSGFTLYPNTTSAFPYTTLSVPLLLTGIRYQHETELVADYMKRVEPLQLGAALEDRGFLHSRLPLLSRSGFLSLEVAECRNMGAILDLYVFRQLPVVFKRVFHDGGKLHFEAACKVGNVPASDPGVDVAVIDKLVDSSVVSSEKPTFKFFHLWGFHLPASNGANCVPSDQLRRDLDGIKQQGTCVLDQLGRYMQRLRDLGVYDQATIVLASDHGAQLGPVGDDDGASDVPKQVRSSANAFLAVKLPGSAGPLKIDEAPLMLDDVFPTIAGSLEIQYSREGRIGADLSRGRPAEPRSRPFLSFRSAEDVRKGRLRNAERFLVEGRVADPEAWTVAGGASLVSSLPLTQVTFGGVGNAADHLGLGWSAESPEHRFSWIMARRAAVHGRLPAGECLKVSLDARSPHPEQKLRIAVNGDVVKAVSFSSAAWQESAFVVRINDASDSGADLVEFLPEVVSPIRGSADPRTLSVAIRLLRFETADCKA